MNAILYAHIPGLKLDRAQVPFAGGRLERLPFDHWISLESEFEYAERKYAKASPVFWIRDLVIRDEATQEEAASEAVWPVHTAFLLDKRAPLIPTPTLSCCYVSIPAPPGVPGFGTGRVFRLIGPMEREFIVYGSPLTYNYSAEDLALVDDLYHFIESSRVSDWNGEVRAAIEVLEETARPDSWFRGEMLLCRLHGFVRCMAATESILLPTEEEGAGEKTQTFGRHAATLLAPFLEDRDRAAKYFADLYRFRSELMHGRSIPDQKDLSVATRLSDGRQLLRDVTCAAMTLRSGIPAGAASVAFLFMDSWDNSERQSMLSAILRKGVHA